MTTTILLIPHPDHASLLDDGQCESRPPTLTRHRHSDGGTCWRSACGIARFKPENPAGWWDGRALALQYRGEPCLPGIWAVAHAIALSVGADHHDNRIRPIYEWTDYDDDDVKTHGPIVGWMIGSYRFYASTASGCAESEAVSDAGRLAADEWVLALAIIAQHLGIGTAQLLEDQP